MVTDNNKTQKFGALSSARANIPSLALQAANELDDIILGVANSSPASKQLGETLLAALQSSKTSGKPVSVRSGTVAVFCYALSGSNSEQRVDTMSDFVEAATKISEQLERASATASELEQLKRFCISLAKASALYRPSAYTCSPQLTRLRGFAGFAMRKLLIFKARV